MTTFLRIFSTSGLSPLGNFLFCFSASGKGILMLSFWGNTSSSSEESLSSLVFPNSSSDELPLMSPSGDASGFPTFLPLLKFMACAFYREGPGSLNVTCLLKLCCDSGLWLGLGTVWDGSTWLFTNFENKSDICLITSDCNCLKFSFC